MQSGQDDGVRIQVKPMFRILKFKFPLVRNNALTPPVIRR